MPSSDSNYAAVTRHRRPNSTSGRPPLDIVDEAWAMDTLSDDEVDVVRHEATVAPLMEEGELDADAIVVSPTGNSSSAANTAAERRRRDEGWNDLGLDQLDRNWASGAANSAASSRPAAPR